MHSARLPSRAATTRIWSRRAACSVSKCHQTVAAQLCSASLHRVSNLHRPARPAASAPTCPQALTSPASLRRTGDKIVAFPVIYVSTSVCMLDSVQGECPWSRPGPEPPGSGARDATAAQAQSDASIAARLRRLCRHRNSPPIPASLRPCVPASSLLSSQACMQCCAQGREGDTATLSAERGL